MPAHTLKDFLDRHQVRYLTLDHSAAYTAMEVAEAAHIRGQLLAKSVIVDIDGQLAMLVIPASHRIDLERLKQSIRAFRMALASEDAFKGRFPDCEVGALPPFGNLFGMDTYLAEGLTEEPEITFCAGSHSELVQMDYRDYARLVQPIIIAHGAVPIGATPRRMKLHVGRHR